ncbi:MAG: sugar transferase [Pirellulaceae bacterium]
MPTDAVEVVASDKPKKQSALYTNGLKRVFDLALTIPAFLALLPLILIVALCVRIRLGSPVLFRQARAGKHGQPFDVYKFRSMTNQTDAAGNLLPDAQRLPPFGNLLRSLSLDELPQLWNVIKGDMSLIGPRPLLTRYLERYSPEQARRHQVRPGITGWAQVNGRNTVDWDARFAMDVWYVDHCSLPTDLLILWKTITCVLRREGVSADNHATMEEFMGPKDSAN